MSDPKKKSVIVLYREMMSALNNTADYTWLTSKCGSQAAIASIERNSIGVQPMTLNTFKKYSDAVIEGGFDEIDKLRVAIKKKAKVGNGSAPSEKINKMTFYKNKLDEAERLRAILIRAYTDLNQICLDAVRKSPEYQFDLDRHNKLYQKYFSLRLINNDE